MKPIQAKCPACGKVRQIGAFDEEKFESLEMPVYEAPCEGCSTEWQKRTRASKLISFKDNL